MKTFTEETRRDIFNRERWKCANHESPKCLVDEGLEIHHILANTKLNTKLYGDDNLQSKENGIVLCKYCHINYSTIKFIKIKKNELIKKWSK